MRFFPSALFLMRLYTYALFSGAFFSYVFFSALFSVTPYLAPPICLPFLISLRYIDPARHLSLIPSYIPSFILFSYPFAHLSLTTSLIPFQAGHALPNFFPQFSQPFTPCLLLSLPSSCQYPSFYLSFVFSPYSLPFCF